MQVLRQPVVVLSLFFYVLSNNRARPSQDSPRHSTLAYVDLGMKSAYKWHLLLTFVSATMRNHPNMTLAQHSQPATMFPLLGASVAGLGAGTGTTASPPIVLIQQADTKSGNPIAQGAPRQDLSSS